MVWTAPRDWSTDEEVTSTNMDTYVSDNLRWLNEQRPRLTVDGNVSVATGSGFVTPTGTWGSASPNAGSMYASSTAMYMNTPTAGVYQFSLMVIFNTSATGKRGAIISTSAAGGGTVLAEDMRTATDNTETTAITITTPLVQLGATSIHFAIRQSSGSSMTCSVRFSGLWVANAT
jgi:hypothetical protein